MIQSNPPGRALVIDNEHGAQLLLSTVLEWHFGDVVVASGADDAIAAAASGPFSIIVLDLRLDRGVSGLDVLAKLRDEGCGAPAIVVSGTPGGIDADRADVLGIVGLLEKPVALETFESSALAAAAGFDIGRPGSVKSLDPVESR